MTEEKEEEEEATVAARAKQSSVRRPLSSLWSSRELSFLGGWKGEVRVGLGATGGGHSPKPDRAHSNPFKKGPRRVEGEGRVVAKKGLFHVMGPKETIVKCLCYIYI